MLPIVIAAIAAILGFGLPILVDSDIPKEIAFYVVGVGIPLCLAIILDRAQKLARRLMYLNPQRNSDETTKMSDIADTE